MSSAYQINKGINKSIEFRGLRAQYITYLAVGLVSLLMLFAILYVIGTNMYLCLALVFGAGTGLVTYIFRLSHQYGQYGLMKRRAKSQLPVYLKFRSRKVFIHLIKNPSVPAASGNGGLRRDHD
jgi:hypothetical protein